MISVGCDYIAKIKNRLKKADIFARDLEAENRRLKKENQRLEIKRDIFKKATASFAKESK